MKALDVSEAALALAFANAEHHGVKVDFFLDDVLHPQSVVWQQPIDLVVSNPPYICECERHGMERNVLDYEPAFALFVPDDDPLLFYRQILTLAKPQLNVNGEVWFEINEALDAEMLNLCREMGFVAAIYDDFAGKPRFIRATIQ